jgi:hypothetical protein
MLDLGPLHIKVRAHISKIIADPSILLASTVTSASGAMDGKEWENPGVITAILKLVPQLPHLSQVLVAFLKGALVTWERFTSEFVPGGLIDEATDLEKDLAWMPPTNDINEGVLGSYRVFMWYKPRTTLHQFNAQAMYRRNKTQEFMDKEFGADDHKFVMQKARELDASGLEKKRQEALIEYAQKQVEQK